jgi:HK97 family phage major capsid protein/HK97 family phage prohead protease
MPDEILKQKELFRRFVTNDRFEIRKKEVGKARTLHFAASSEYPVDRWYGVEVLSHDKKAVKLDRADSGAMPLLFNHDMDDPIGMITKATVSDGRLMVEAALFETARAGEVEVMIDGGLRNVSLAYRVNVLEENTQSQTFTATDWSPYEVSIVTVPADPTVGIGRGSETEYNLRIMRSANLTKERIMPTQTDLKVEQSDDVVKVNPVAAEKMRRAGIENLCKANKLPDETRDHWISQGASMNIVAEEMLGIMEERGRTNPQSVAKLGLTAKETQRFNLCRAIDSCGSQNWNKAEFEAECSREIAKKLGRTVSDRNTFFVPLEIQERQQAQRDLTVATGTAGGFLVETTNVGFIEALRNRSVMMAMGATTLSGLQANVAIPKHTTLGTVTWLANEASTITETNQVLAQVTLTPKTVGGYTEISRLLLLQSNPSAEAFVSNDLAAIVATAVDLAGLNGSGASGQPLGIIGTAGIGGVTGTSIAYAGIVEFQTDVAGGNALTGSCGYVTTPVVAGLLKQRVKFTSTASPIWEGQLLDGMVDGYKAMASLQVPTADILFGDFGQVIIGEWGVLELEINPYANFQAGIVGVRAIYTVDIAVRYPSAFSLATSVT